MGYINHRQSTDCGANSKPKPKQTLSLSEAITERIDDALEREAALTKSRDYLGASRLGVTCERALQYEYRHVPEDEGRTFSGRTLRIFEAGHVFEALAISWLKKAGFALFTENADGEQFGFSVAGGRIQGHIDGLIVSGPAIENARYPCLWECKSLCNTSFNATLKHGLKKAHPLYAAQVALYQAYMEAEFASIQDNPVLFMAINKDTAALYFEWIRFDSALAQQASDRGVHILKASDAGELLPRHTTSPKHFACRLCPWQRRCWQGG